MVKFGISFGYAQGRLDLLSRSKSAASFNETGTIFDEVIFRGVEFQTALAEKNLSRTAA
jgi:hypothetical protein